MLSSPQRRCRVLSSTLNEINQSLAPSVISNHHHHHHRVERLETAPFPGPIDPPLAPHEEGVPNSVRKSKWPLPKYMHNIIVHQQMHEKKPQDESKLMRQLAKSIMLPDDPSDPAAFTVTPGLTRPPKPPWCSSKPVLKIVGTFAFMMSLGIIIAIIYLNCEYLLPSHTIGLCSATLQSVLQKRLSFGWPLSIWVLLVREASKEHEEHV